jgi:Na+/H+-dicarboxylate symporter
MGMTNFRKFDVQARWSLLFSSFAAFCVICIVGLIFRNWNSQLQSIAFGHGTMFQKVIFFIFVVSVLASLFGLALGWNSAGQKRNDKQKASWIGFFLGTAALSITIVCAYAFMTLRQGMDLGGG